MLFMIKKENNNKKKIKQVASLPSTGQRNHDIVEEIQEENFDKYHVD